MTNNDFCMKTRLCNYFITTNSIALTKAVLESPYRVLPRTLKATTLKRPVHFYWPPHFDNVNQTCFFGNCILTCKLAILFNWFLNRSPEIKANGNSTKLPTSNTNFGKKVTISESHHNTLTLLKRLKFLWPLAV